MNRLSLLFSTRDASEITLNFTFILVVHIIVKQYFKINKRSKN